MQRRVEIASSRPMRFLLAASQRSVPAAAGNKARAAPTKKFDAQILALVPKRVLV